MELKNRLVRSATLENMCVDDCPTNQLYKLYERLAKGGAALIITGAMVVSKEGAPPITGMPVIDRDELIGKWRELVNYVHENDSKIAMQIGHSGKLAYNLFSNKKRMTPSPLKRNFKAMQVFPTKEMTEEDIDRTVEDFARTALRAKKIGFDAVQLHACHDDLLYQFLSPHWNRRTDHWGGNTENRVRFIREIYERCRKYVGEDYPILIKISTTDYLDPGLQLDEGVVIAEMLAEMGFNGIEASCGCLDNGNSPAKGKMPFDVFINEMINANIKSSIIRIFMKRIVDIIMKPGTPDFPFAEFPFTEAYNRNAAQTIKNRLKEKNLTTPVFVVGGITKPETMTDIIENETADYISLCRPLIADAKFPDKIRKGSNKASICVHCNLCVGYFMTRPLRCYYGKDDK